MSTQFGWGLHKGGTLSEVILTNVTKKFDDITMQIEENKVVASLDPHPKIEIDSLIHLKVNAGAIHIFDPETAVTLV